MNSKEFIGELSRRLGYTNRDATQLVASLSSILASELQEDKAIVVNDFGSFEVKKKLERIVVNPATRQRMLVPPKLVLGFKPAASLKQRVNGDAGAAKAYGNDTLMQALAATHHMEAEDAESFVAGFFAFIVECLVKDRYLKVRGFGAFKLVEVESKTAASYSKVSFSPEASLKDAVNKPFAHFETVVLRDDVHFDDLEEGASSDDIDAADTVDAADAADNTDAADVPETTEVSDTPEVSEAPGAADTIDNTPDPAVVSEPAEVSEPAVAPEPAYIPEPANTEKTSQKYSPWCMIATVLFVGVVVGGIAVWSILSGRRYIPEELVEYLEKNPGFILSTDTVLADTMLADTVLADTVLADTVSSDTISADTVTADTVTVAPAPPIPEKTVAGKSVSEKSEPVKAVAEKKTVPAEVTPAVKYLTDTVKYKITGTMATHTIVQGNTLAKVAYKFYRNKKLWPYIVKHNEDIIKNPDNVPIGTVINVPLLEPK